MHDYIDLYCERTEPGLWAEPLNALTNLAFIIAAVMVWRLARQQDRIGTDGFALTALLVAIGIGSGLFHTFANSWSMWLDELPILLFQICFIGLYLNRVVELHWYGVAFGLILFIVTIYGAAALPEHIHEASNGSLGYAPALLALLVLGLYHRVSHATAPYLLLFASGVFLLSLTFRTIDNAVCEQIPFGSHFLWHLFNALLLYLVSRAYLLNR
ncbi:ceramidase domain-containing protein [Porticoccaceae bacterium LTM1]|nr:ceramidase domain-containing protein [Porticoccaceae bacterium LTM1]